MLERCCPQQIAIALSRFKKCSHKCHYIKQIKKICLYQCWYTTVDVKNNDNGAPLKTV